MKLNRTLFVRKNIPILAVLLALLGFFGVRFDSVKSVILDRLQLLSAGETFSCTLEDQTAVEDRHGKIDSSGKKGFVSRESAPGECRYGFISIAKKDGITFPVDGNITYFKAGTVQFCLTLERKLEESKDDLSLFRTAQGPNAIILQLVDGKGKTAVGHPSYLRLRIKSDYGESNGRVRSEMLEWEVGEHYHIAGTWGKRGLNLYINGKSVDHKKHYKYGPRHLSGRFVVNNDSTDPEDYRMPTYCIIGNLVIHNAQLDAEDLGEECPIREHWFPEE